MQIVSITLIVVGICMFTGFSIVDFMKNRIEVVKEKRTKNVEEPEDEIHKNKVKISNGNEIEEPDKQIIKSIDELKKIQTVKEEK